ncbi:MAG TPA: hypothetical protein VEW03_00125 [Longimicrobiaceae bacterium]|nr:hypothetical protein [Longimicrobiaceae bacterium]
MRKSSIFLYVVVSLCTACGAVRYPVPAELATVAPLRVNGRQGVLVHERLSFGPYATGEVSRSSTRGTDVTDVLDSHGAEYRQRYSFALAQGGSKVADVECTAEGSGAQTLSVTWRLKRVLSCRLTAPDGALHILQLESSRDEPLAGRVTGSRGFEVAGSNRVGGGRVSGTAGYTISRGGGGPAAAVDVTNDGSVYIAGTDDDLLAAVAAALLLYQDPLQAAERFRDP